MLPKVILLGTCHSFGRLLCFLFDGIFIGATATHLMLKAMIVASVSFFLIYYGFRGQWAITLYGWHSLPIFYFAE